MTPSRRAVIAGGVALALAPAAAATPSRALGLQLYTLRVPFAADPMGTLGRVAAIGYREVEFGGGGYEAMDHAALRRRMDGLGLAAPSIHVDLARLTDDLAGATAMARTLGATTLVVPWIAEPQRTADAWPRTVELIGTLAHRLAGEDLRLAYHNHDFEFTERVGDVTLYDHLLGHTDPRRVRLELDLYWANSAGLSLLALMQRTRDRLHAFHVKDRSAAGRMVAVGAGTIDFAALLALPDATRVEHLFVENDDAPAPFFPDVSASYRVLRALVP